MNWEFLVGLLVPAFGMGFAWLANIAREDPDMYGVVERSLRYWSLVLLGISAVIFLDAFHDRHVPREFRLASMASFFSLSVFFASAFGSTFLFRRITKLPPKQGAEPRSSSSQ